MTVFVTQFGQSILREHKQNSYQLTLVDNKTEVDSGFKLARNPIPQFLV
jgi:hypothetical protein